MKLRRDRLARRSLRCLYRGHCLVMPWSARVGPSCFRSAEHLFTSSPAGKAGLEVLNSNRTPPDPQEKEILYRCLGLLVRRDFFRRATAITHTVRARTNPNWNHSGLPVTHSPTTKWLVAAPQMSFNKVFAATIPASCNPEQAIELPRDVIYVRWNLELCFQSVLKCLTQAQLAARLPSCQAFC